VTFPEVKPARHLLSLAVAAALGLTVAWQTGLTADTPAQVQVADGHIQINATTTPLSVVLDRISHSTGMKVVYEGAPPSDRVTVAIDARTETEALSRLLEGLGLTHAFKLDATGKRVETLFISTTATTASSGRRATTYRPSASAEPVEEMTEEPALSPENPPELPSGDPSTVNANPGMGNMGATTGSQLAPGTAPEIDQNQQPGFPSPASYPTSPGVNPTFAPRPITLPAPPNPYSFPSR
jgi:hypothetical protein